MPILAGLSHVHSTRFEDHVSPEAVASAWERVARRGAAAGLDRVDMPSFSLRNAEYLHRVREGFLDGTYRFSPYREVLRSKGRSKPPRVISLPTIRDRVALALLKEYLHAVFPESVNRVLPNAYIREIKELVEVLPQCVVLRGDIQAFYDRIPRWALMELVGARVPEPALTMVRRAICRPTVPTGTPKRDRNRFRASVGIPQGLAISNILANIYLQSFDEVVASRSKGYFRYVDDLLVFADPTAEHTLLADISSLLNNKKLELNPDKSSVKPLTKGFEYLGYVFTASDITVKKASVERLLGSIAGLFAEYRHRRHPQNRPKWQNAQLVQEILIDRLNERITGAISETRRYGWLFYFQEVNDLALLRRIDRIVERMFERLPEFGGKRPRGLKRMARAYYEVRYRPDAGYILNYNALKAVNQRIRFLQRTGEIDPKTAKEMGPDEINELFEKVRDRRLAALERDVGTLS